MTSRQRLWPLLKEKLGHSLDGWLCYFKQPILPSSLAYVLLFLNVVLSPHGLITAFLTSWGFDGRASAVFRGGCASESGCMGSCVGGEAPLVCKQRASWECQVEGRQAGNGWVVELRLCCAADIFLLWRLRAGVASMSHQGVTAPALAAACGFLGTALGKHMIQTVGLLKAGQNALLIKAS